MEHYIVTGMSCAACSARVEKAVSALPGVDSCAVSLLTNSMGVEGSASPAEVIAAVEKAGYGASLKEEGQHAQSAPAAGEDPLADRETPVLKRRLIASLAFLAALMYLSMGHMWGLPLPAFLEEDPAGRGVLQLVLAALVMVINQKFFVSGFRGLLHKAPNMDTLVALGSGAAFCYSTAVLLALSHAQAVGDAEAAARWAGEFYFESAAMILALITVGKLLEARSKGKTTDALKGLISLAPKTATVVREGREQTVPASQVRPGDLFVVRPGEAVPVDGVVEEGSGAVDESALTGESIPVDKEPGDPVTAATLNQAGFLKCRATRVGEDTTISQIIRMVSDAAATKAPIAKIADRVSGVFVPAVIAVALVTIAVWLAVGQEIGFALARGISVLVISCPCALGLATPVAIMVGSGRGAKNGILFKTAQSLEEAGKVSVVALDKTGTLTQGQPEVTDLLPFGEESEESLLALALALESKSEHPLARAILREGETRRMTPAETADFRALPGNGLTAALEDVVLRGGSGSFISGQIELPPEAASRGETLASEGKTPLFFTRGNRLAGIIAVADTLKEDSRQAVRDLREMGIRVVMLTGDNPRTAQAIATQAGVDQVVAGVLPDGKEAVIRRLKEQGRVAMVGDGVNDAPALTQADVGVAIGAGADVAIDAAQVVLVNSRLSQAVSAIRLSRAALRIIHQNLFWAFFYNVIGIPLAAGVFIHWTGWQLSPMFGAAAMSLSSFCVVSNALRLNFVDLTRSHGRRAQISAEQPPVCQTVPAEGDESPCGPACPAEGASQKTLHIAGMMCTHCEGRVRAALEALPQVAEAQVSWQEGLARVKLSAPAEDAALKAAVEAEDYEVTEIC